MSGDEKPRGYRCIDETDPLGEDGLAEPWSVQSVFLFTVFVSPLVGGAMAILNCERLRIPEEKRTTILVTAGSCALLALVRVLSFFTIDPDLLNLIHIIATLSTYAAAYYYRNTQTDALIRHLDQGGKTGSVRGPLIVSTLYFLAKYLVEYLLYGY